MVDAVAEIGGDPSGGISRLGYTLEERKTHALVAGWYRDVGLEVWEDSVGNTLAKRAGTDPELPAIAVGSHLDSVPNGGRFDGIAGAIGTVELMRLLADMGVETAHPILGVAFASEEGARFGEPCIGSKFVVGSLGEADLSRIRDAQGMTLEEAMASAGLSPLRLAEARWSARDVALFLELHVEQGGILEADGRQIGLVDVVSGSTRIRLVLRGKANHSGATPMSGRADAFVGAAELALAVESLASDPSYRGLRATVGRVDVWPNTMTTIPGRVTMTVDIRDTDSDRQRRAAAEIMERARWICGRRRLDFSSRVIADTSPTVLAMWVRERLKQTCESLGLTHRFMTSGASHDAQVVSRLVATGMVFVPSKGGLSHVPEEWSSAADIARGVDVLVGSVLEFDQFLLEVEARSDAEAAR
jgi:hydantoinase/carbamoylase family amidase